MLHAFAVSLLLLTGCGPSKLDRGAALKSINASSKFSPDTDEYSLSRAQTQCGVQAGLWKVAGSTNILETALYGFHYRYALTAKGRSLCGDIRLGSDATVQLGIPHRRTALFAENTFLRGFGAKCLSEATPRSVRPSSLTRAAERRTDFAGLRRARMCAFFRTS
jgi:hypothetical protein